MSDIVLIGSRGLNYHNCARKIDEKNTDYDFIATQSAAFLWLSNLKGHIEFARVDYSYDVKAHHTDIEHDIRNWKHLDSKMGSELYAQLCKLKGVSKIRGHTENIKFEIEVAEPGSSGDYILQLSKDMPITESSQGGAYIIASLSILEVIKTSHIIYPYDFRKHMDDLILIREQLGRNILYNYAPKRSKDLDKLLVHRRLEHYLRLGVPGSHINLNKMNEDFLENETILYVDKYIKHDDLHLRVMIDGKAPAYDELRTNKAKAMMNKDLFDKAPDTVKFNCVREEAMSIALERYILPDREMNPQVAYTKALIRVCTTLTKGWFREFAINVYHLVCKLETDLMKIKKDIRDEYDAAEKAKQMALEQKAEFERTRAEIVKLAFTRDYEYRAEYLFPLIFGSEGEIMLAQEMADSIVMFCKMGQDVYKCKLPESDIYIYFSAGAEYEYVKNGWCDNYNRWHAYICVTTDSNYDYDNDEDNWGYLHYEDIANNYGYEDEKGIRLAFSMQRLADDSFSGKPSINNLFASSLNDIIGESSNFYISSEFLMKFIIGIVYPKQFGSLGHSAMPSSSVHYLYEIWKRNVYGK